MMALLTTTTKRGFENEQKWVRKSVKCIDLFHCFSTTKEYVMNEERIHRQFTLNSFR